MTEVMHEHGALARLVFAVAVLVSLAVLFAPSGDVPSAPPGVDKVIHLVLFGVLAFTGRWAGLPRAPLAGLLVLYAAASELLQALPVVARSSSVADWVADVAGVLLGLLLWGVLARRLAAR
ncbi:VanZ family protein [Geodermatophilus sp. SYSU D00691]